MTTQKEVSVAFSGNIPANYESFLGPMFFEPFAGDMAGRLRAFRPRSILETACGTGRVTRKLPEIIPMEGTILATDINPAMVAHAQTVSGPDSRIRWEVADAVSLPYGDAMFDCVISQFGVMFYSDRPQASAEAMRVLKPGGVFLFNAWDKLEHNPAARMTDHTLTRFFPTDTPAFYKVPFSYWDEEQIRQDLTMAGFGNIRMEVVSLTGYAGTPEMAAKGLLEGTPVHTAIVERNETLLEPMRRALAEELAEMFGHTDLSVPVQARVVLAVKAT